MRDEKLEHLQAQVIPLAPWVLFVKSIHVYTVYSIILYPCIVCKVYTPQHIRFNCHHHQSAEWSNLINNLDIFTTPPSNGGPPYLSPKVLLNSGLKS